MSAVVPRTRARAFRTGLVEAEQAAQTAADERQQTVDLESSVAARAMSDFVNVLAEERAKRAAARGDREERKRKRKRRETQTVTGLMVDPEVQLQASADQLERDMSKLKDDLYKTTPRVRAETSSLFRSLDTPPARDRWDELGQNILLADAASLPPVPAEHARWQRAQSMRGRHERLGAPLPRAYLQGFLRPPRRDAGERACCAGDECQGMLMYRRSHLHASPHGEGFTLRELLLPEQLETWQSQHELPSQPGFCVLCTRFLVSRWAKARSMAGSGDFTGLLCPHSVIAGVPGEYALEACLYAQSPVHGVDRLIPEFADNRYAYEESASGERFLSEVGVLYDAHLNSAGLPPPAAGPRGLCDRQPRPSAF